MGAASLVVALLVMFTLPEPARRSVVQAGDAAGAHSFRALLRKPTFQHQMLAAGWGAAASYGALAWGIVYIVRYFGWTPGQAGAVLFTSPTEGFLRSLTLAPGYALLQRMAPPDARARAAAVQSITATLVGLGLGPLIVGAVSDGLAPVVGEDSLRWGLAALLIPQALSAFHIWRAARTLRADLIE
ncbi:MAG: hypothetical protein EBZ50_09970 [Alphaproteobacteria bacterium]|nr:hypothetical protein [Alphaproteobacteria bacterium]